jgi:hypothetical protein
MAPTKILLFSDFVMMMMNLLLIGKIKLTPYGIPLLDYRPPDNTRNFIKIPLDVEEPTHIVLKKQLEGIDKYFDQKSIKEKLFGKKADKYQYQPCIKLKESEYIESKSNQKSNNKNLFRNKSNNKNLFGKKSKKHQNQSHKTSTKKYKTK